MSRLAGRVGLAGRGRAGFTLIEALAAFAILAVLTLGVQRGVVAASTSSVRAQSVAAAERVARTALATPMPDLTLASPRLSGTIDGVDWTLAATPLPLPPPPADAAGWAPVRVRLSVPAGPLEVETVRLIRAGP